MSENDGRELWAAVRELTRAHNQCVRTLQAEIEALRAESRETAQALEEIKQTQAVTVAA